MAEPTPEPFDGFAAERFDEFVRMTAAESSLDPDRAAFAHEFAELERDVHDYLRANQPDAVALLGVIVHARRLADAAAGLAVTDGLIDV